MTLGFAFASLVDGPFVGVVADTRVTRDDVTAGDAGVKNYDLGSRFALVSAGAALPPISAAEIVRGIIGNHNRRNPETRLSFVDVSRLTAFFLSRIRRETRAPDCDAVLAGFLLSGEPALGHVVVSNDANSLTLIRPREGGLVMRGVGIGEGQNLLVAAADAAVREKKPVIAATTAMLWYLASHEGENFRSVGGGISVGSCGPGEDFAWPLVKIGDQVFLHGMDVTRSARPNWPDLLELPYDESWCAQVDASADTRIATLPRAGGAEDALRYEIDAVVTAESLFKTHDEPEEWRHTK